MGRIESGDGYYLYILQSRYTITVKNKREIKNKINRHVRFRVRVLPEPVLKIDLAKTLFLQ